MEKIFILILCFLIHSLNAQDWINCTNGFHVNDMVQDDDVLWVATTGGLVKRDLDTGDNLFFTRGDSPIPGNNVRSVAIDADSNLWLSTDRGSAIFDGNNWTTFYEKSGLVQLDNDGRMIIAETDSIHWWDGQDFESIEFPWLNYFLLTDIAVDPSDDAIWLTYYTFGVYAVYRYKDQQFELFNHENTPLPFESPAFNPLQIDNEGRLWVGNTEGLFRYDNEEWFDFSSEINGFPQGEITAIKTNSSENLWVIVSVNTVGINDYLVEIRNDDTFIIHDLPEEIIDETRIGAIGVLESSSPQVLIGTFHYGMWEYDLTSWSKIPTSQSAALSNNIYQIFIDGSTTYMTSGSNYYYDGNIMFTINQGDWTFYIDKDLPFSINEGHPVSIVEKGDNDTLWIHSGDTLLAFVDGVWALPEQPDILNDVLEINSFIHHAPNGNKWLLEKWQSYLFFESNQGWQVFDHTEHGAVSGIYTTYFTHPQTGDFWLASANGISIYDGQNWIIIKPSDLSGLGSDWVYNMEIDENGVIWANTREAILKIENNTPEIFVTEIPGYAEYAFRNFTFDAEYFLWVGLDHAIAKFDGTDWEVFDNTNSGVPNGQIREMEFDQEGNLWLGSSGGGFAVYNENGLPDYFFEDFHVATNDPVSSESASNFIISPNPGWKDTALNIRIPEEFDIDNSSTLSIYNNLGQLIEIFSPTRNMSVTPMNLTSGIYVFQLRNKTQSMIQKVIIH